ncbi:SIR2 family protein [Pirellulaceae bacterium SH467]
MSIDDQLSAHLSKIGTAPFLFVGSGLSRRYVDLETWEHLLRRFSNGLSHPFEYYYGLAERNLPQTATMIAEAFYEKWWSAIEYEGSRAAFKENICANSSCLKFEIASYLLKQQYIPGANPAIDVEIELLKQATVDGVITTNWDTSLESIFPGFEVYIGQDQILFSVSQGIAEIYKIHGCASEPNSLVLTTADYANFNDRNPYLAAKLLTIFVEHPVIFLGYSLSDENITSILRQIASCLTNSNIDKLKDRLIFVQIDKDCLGDSFESSVTQVDGHAIPVTIIRTNDFSQIYRPLSRLKRKFSARLLRKMKEHVYELVKSSDPKSKLGVVDIDVADTFGDLDVVFGVGVAAKVGRVGYNSISRLDLFNDVMASVSQYDPLSIVKDLLPTLMQNTPFVPIFRYLREAGLIAADGTIDVTSLHSRVARTAGFGLSNYYSPKSYRRELERVQNECRCVKKVVETYGENAYLYISMLRKDQIDLTHLRNYITANMKFVSPKKTQTYFRRLICLYDWLAYR